MIKKVGVLIQARLGSSRLPGKMLLPIHGLTLLERVALASSKIRADEYAIVCPESDVEVFSTIMRNTEYKVIGGSETNVVERFVNAIVKLSLDVVVHITGDKPFLSAKYTQISLDHHLNCSCDLTTFEDHPLIGLTGAIYYPPILAKALNNPETTKYQLEHVKPCYTENPECKHCKMPVPDHLKKITNFQYTIDNPSDYRKVLDIYKALYPKWPVEIDEI
jgi:spore coat polysaccharide biosynthesis protein SpsF